MRPGFDWGPLIFLASYCTLATVCGCLWYANERRAAIRAERAHKPLDAV